MAFLFNPLHVALHQHLNWDFAYTYSFARNDPWVPLARSEIRRLSQHLPVLVAKRGGDWVPVVPLETGEPGKSPLDEDFGWRFGRPPTALRYHPFQALETGEEKPVLAVAVDDKTVGPDRTNRFFDQEGRPAPLIKAILRRLQQLRLERKQSEDAAKALAEASVLKPLPDLKDRQGRTPFWTVDQEAFFALSGDDLATLGEKPHHAFLLAIAMLYSSRFLPGKTQRSTVPLKAAERREEEEEPAYAGDEDSKLFFNFDQN
ncbi:SapC family protein [Tianweitania sediminis]|uniref:SapC family protein n=1 Tax=Tianweitania sediminis TaxID=1502156 RepID=A0A8J7UGT6_9HYPH|nr:SapC family protein [Tianweitania sediminis]MBP0438514.1 SapC family protein [Tianweitania sediminis]